MKASDYNVFDLETCEYIAKNIDYKQVSKLIGLSSANVCLYCREGRICKGKYIIESNVVIEIPKELLIEWDKVRLGINPRAKR